MKSVKEEESVNQNRPTASPLDSCQYAWPPGPGVCGGLQPFADKYIPVKRIFFTKKNFKFKNQKSFFRLLEMLNDVR